MSYNLIGFSGLASSGKDTAADYLVKKMKNCHKISFANAVKDVASILFSWDRKLLQGDSPESRKFRETKDEFWSNCLKKDFTPRLAMQLIGTECFRKPIDASFWIYVLQNQLSKTGIDNHTYILSDVRFPEEVNMIHSLGGKVYRIWRFDPPAWYKEAALYNQQKIKGSNCIEPSCLKDIHISERSLAGLNLEDSEIDNRKTLYEYYETLDKIFKLG